jgi:hypothetical protein
LDLGERFMERLLEVRVQAWRTDLPGTGRDGARQTVPECLIVRMSRFMIWRV